jgi:hypothetical protein
MMMMMMIKRTLMVYDPQMTLQFAIIKGPIVLQYNLLIFSLFPHRTSPRQVFKSDTKTYR